MRRELKGTGFPLNSLAFTVAKIFPVRRELKDEPPVEWVEYEKDVAKIFPVRRELKADCRHR